MRLGVKEHIVAMAPEHHSGPGWANQTVCVVVLDEDGKLRREYMQPAEMSDEIVTLFRIGAEVHAALSAAVRRSVKEAKRSKRR